MDEIAALADFAHQHNLFLHMDGARIANAVVALDCSLRALLRDTGVDVVSFGGTKNGLMNAEAVIFLNPAQALHFPYLRKQAMQLASKMRFVSVQLEVCLRSGLWLENAKHANQMAQKLAHAVFALPGIEPVWPVQSNAVFARVPRALIAPLQKEFYIYVWDETIPVVRWMCSFDTQTEELEAFVQTARNLLFRIHSEV